MRCLKILGLTCGDVRGLGSEGGQLGLGDCVVLRLHGNYEVKIGQAGCGL